MDVFCKDCVYCEATSKTELVYCNHPNNLKAKNWFSSIPISRCDELNKNNDCIWFTDALAEAWARI